MHQLSPLKIAAKVVKSILCMILSMYVTTMQSLNSIRSEFTPKMQLSFERFNITVTLKGLGNKKLAWNCTDQWRLSQCKVSRICLRWSLRKSQCKGFLPVDCKQEAHQLLPLHTSQSWKACNIVHNLARASNNHTKIELDRIRTKRENATFSFCVFSNMIVTLKMAKVIETGMEV